MTILTQFLTPALLLVAATRVSAESSLVDLLRFGNVASEQSHALRADHSDLIAGGLSEPARRLLPLEPQTWQGGTLTFTLKTDPAKQNYFTIRFWGSDVTENRLVLYCAGKQIGWFHLGEIETLDSGNEDNSPAYNNRFFYHTSPLPLSLTKGKQELPCEIRSMGRIWGYGTNWDQYQKVMTGPSRSIYAVYTHTDGCFMPAADEKQGQAIENPQTRAKPGVEIFDQVKARINREIDNELASATPLNEIQMQFLAQAYHVKWSRAFQNPAVVTRITEGVDNLQTLWEKNPVVMQNAPGAYNPDWLLFGPAGEAVTLLAEPLAPKLDQTLASGATRRAAWSEMFQASRDYARTHRRQYTNQSMIVDLNAYRANRAVAALDLPKALPEAQMLDYLYQSIGIKPWLGSDTNAGPAKPLSEGYMQLTAKGLTKELGYVGYYGEVIDWVTSIYNATRSVSAAGFGPGDAKIKEKLVKIVKARAIFRHPMLDADGNRAMRLEAVVGWRDEGHYPGNVAYADRPSWDGSPLNSVAATLDPDSVGYAQQMFADNQFFAAVQASLKDGGLRVTAGLLGVPDQYEAVKAAAASKIRLPMSWDQPDFAWADEENGVVAVKHGKEIFYASLYWRARYAINYLARVHDMTPSFDRVAVVRQEEEFTPSGLEYTYPDWINFAFGNGGTNIPYPKDLHQALAGEKLPIAQIPAGIRFRAGDENSYAGRADFYKLRYGPWLIAMNSSATKSFTLTTPASATRDLLSKKDVTPNAALSVAPHTTVVLYAPQAP